MIKYYNGNTIYNLIESVYSFRYCTENLWILVYGNRDCDPKVIILLAGYGQEEYESKTITNKESDMLVFLEQISSRSKVPSLYVRFNQDMEILDEVKIMKFGRFSSISMEEYTNLLVGYGIQKNGISSKKSINSRASNVYHVWQTNCGLDITTSDIDLMRVDSNLIITEVYELKRSYYSIQQWEPFQADFNNFILLSKLFSKCNIDFYIMFNHYEKESHIDDINQIKLYKVNYDNTLKIEKLGIQNISDFLISLCVKLD